jgi:hypothetical protein
MRSGKYLLGVDVGQACSFREVLGKRPKLRSVLKSACRFSIRLKDGSTSPANEQRCWNHESVSSVRSCWRSKHVFSHTRRTYAIASDLADDSWSCF